MGLFNGKKQQEETKMEEDEQKLMRTKDAIELLKLDAVALEAEYKRKKREIELEIGFLEAQV